MIPLWSRRSPVRALFSQMGNSLCRDRLYSSPHAFSQMNNSVGLHKILICENYRWSSYSQALS